MRVKELHPFLLIMSQMCNFYTNPANIITYNTISILHVFGPITLITFFLTFCVNMDLVFTQEVLRYKGKGKGKGFAPCPLPLC